MTKVLVVEDNAHIRGISAKALVDEGYDVTTAADGAQAKTLLAKQLYDLLVTDIMLPGATGADLIEFLKSHHSQTRIIVLSAVAKETSTTDEEMRKKLGVAEFLSKPCRVDVLLAAVRKVLKG